MTKKKILKIIKYLILGIILILLDQITKVLITDKYIEIIPNFLNFTYTQNTGGAFGIGKFIVITIISILIILGLIIYIIKNYKKIRFFFPFVLIISGSLSNLGDRIVRKYVIDFIDVNLFNFPNFNIADICIVVGIIYLSIIYLFNINKLNKKNLTKE